MVRRRLFYQELFSFNPAPEICHFQSRARSTCGVEISKRRGAILKFSFGFCRGVSVVAICQGRRRMEAVATRTGGQLSRFFAFFILSARARARARQPVLVTVATVAVAVAVAVKWTSRILVFCAAMIWSYMIAVEEL